MGDSPKFEVLSWMLHLVNIEENNISLTCNKFDHPGIWPWQIRLKARGIDYYHWWGLAIKPYHLQNQTRLFFPCQRWIQALLEKIKVWPHSQCIIIVQICHFFHSENGMYPASFQGKAFGEKNKETSPSNQKLTPFDLSVCITRRHVCEKTYPSAKSNNRMPNLESHPWHVKSSNRCKSKDFTPINLIQLPNTFIWSVIVSIKGQSWQVSSSEINSQKITSSVPKWITLLKKRSQN